MCGIVGFLDRTDGEQGALGGVILGMLDALECRGPDSAGVALFGPPQDCRYVVRVKLGDGGNLAAHAGKVENLAESASSTSFETVASYARFLVEDQIDIKQLIARIEALDPDL